MENENTDTEKTESKRYEKKILIACGVIAGVVLILTAVLILLLRGGGSDTETTAAVTETAAVTTATTAKITTEASTTTASTTTTEAITTTTTTVPTEKPNADISSYEGYWYTEEYGAENELHIHSTNDDGLVFTLSIFRAAGYDWISARLDGDTAYFDQSGISGSMTFKKGYIIFDVEYADNPYVPTSPKNYTSHGKQEVKTSPTCNLCGVNMFTDEEAAHGYCDYCYATSYCHSCGQIKPNDVFEGQCSSCSGEYCDSCGADITYRGGTYDTNGDYLCDDCLALTGAIITTCPSCSYQFDDYAGTWQHICPSCGSSWTDW